MKRSKYNEVKHLYYKDVDNETNVMVIKCLMESDLENFFKLMLLQQYTLNYTEIEKVFDFIDNANN